MDYAKEQELRARARSMAAGMRALVTPSAHDAARELAASLRAMGGASEYEVEAAKAASGHRRARALSAELHKLDIRAWAAQQAALSDEYRAQCERLLAGGGPVKSVGCEWEFVPGTKVAQKVEDTDGR